MQSHSPVDLVDPVAVQSSSRRIGQPSSTVSAPHFTTAPPEPPRDDWDPKDCEILIKLAKRPRFLESSGIKIRAFLDDAELFLKLCGRPHNRWGYFILMWLGADESEKVQCSQLVDKADDYDTFKTGVITLFGRLEFEDSYRQKLRKLKQSASELINDYAARTSDLVSRGFPNYTTDAQLNIAVEKIVAGLADVSTREFLRRDHARRRIYWTKAV